MNKFDIILAIPLLYAAWRGFRDGVVVQLFGMVGLLVGVYFAFRYSRVVGGWMNLDSTLGAVLGFLAILIVVLVGISLLGHLLKRAFSFAGLGPMDAIAGALLSILKMALILSLLLGSFESLNRITGWVESRHYTESILYRPIRESGRLLFPYLDLIKEQWTKP